MEESRFSNDVTSLLNEMNHPQREEIEYLRALILSSKYELDEGVKWNGPNYSYHGEDRLTMNIRPQKQPQLILHRGAKVKEQPDERILKENYDFMIWKSNDRAIIVFHNMEEIRKNEGVLHEIIAQWIELTIDPKQLTPPT